MQNEINVFPLDNSPGYLIHRLDMQMALDLQHAFQANDFAITPEQWGVLNRLWENEGVHQSVLAEKTGKDRPNITRILNLLEKNGIIHRAPDGEDKRRINVYLTREGKSLKQKLIPIAIDYLEKCFEGLTSKEIQDLRRIHEHILKNLSFIRRKRR